MAGKLLGSLLGWIAALLWPQARALQAGILGIAPIWLEVAASRLSGVEPGRESRKSWRLLDGAVDAWAFVIGPAAWLISTGGLPGWAERLALALFLAAGLFRLGRFIRTGLAPDGRFEGLPVTYTGYFWIGGIFLLSGGWNEIFAVSLTLLAVLMSARNFRVRPSR
jgi:hypothetical protein